MKKSFPVITGLLCAACVVGLFGCGKTEPVKWTDQDEWLNKEAAIPSEAYALPRSMPNYGSAAVHDPSVFHDAASGKYYAFGSHFAVASSEDLISWQQENRDGDTTKLFGTAQWRTVLAEADKHAGGHENVWAPDVEKIGDTYYLYYSLTSGFGSNKSIIGRVESDNVMGPYSNEKVIVKTNGKSNEPNAIDPELFYDKDGGLWMVYGSFYSGIYIKELYNEGENVGLPKEDGTGKLLWKGSSGGVEGPFVFYNATTEYYYLMTSDGSLRRDDGFADYNMRVARSKNPDGPYTDITGADVSARYGGGNKLAGNYQFSGGTGYGAMGHNSVTKKDGKYFVVYHARTREAGDKVSLGHRLQVNQLFFNEEGWPVLSPNRYAGESAGLITAAQAAGDYDIVVHTAGNDVTFASSMRYTLAADGKIKNAGVDAGSWTVKQDYYVEITLDNVVYKGVMAPAWNSYSNKAALCMTATSAAGRSLWVNGI